MVEERVVERLQAARERAPAIETEHALARLESALFGAPERKPMLARYTLVRRIGRGGSGVVWLAHDPRLDREVALKLLDRADGFDVGTQGRARLLREAQALARSPHPNVIAVYDVGTYATDAGTGLFVVMEYVEGPDLRRWLDTPRSWTEVLDAFVDAAHGLAAAHRVGVVHRDFKPANAIVGGDGRVRVLDFGLARGLDRSESSIPSDGGDESDLDAKLTLEGTVLGTPFYMAPEQHAGASADPRSDQFALCVSLWEAIYGVRPFVGGSLDELRRAKEHSRPSPPRTDVPRWLCDVLQRGLAPDPAQRWPSIDAMLAAIAARRRAGPRRARTLAVVALLGTGALASWSLLGDGHARCRGADDRIAALWAAGPRAETEAAFTASGISYAGGSFARVDAHVQRFGDEWIAQHRAACETSADEQLDLRMACLERQLDRTRALIDVLRSADAKAIERAAGAELPTPELCSDIAALELASPEDPELATQVEALRAELATVQALDDAGKIPAAAERADAIATHAEALGFAPLVAEALLMRGMLEEHVGRYDDAARTLARAHETAVACRHDRVATRAAKDMVFVEGERRGRLDEALRWAGIADAELQRADLLDHRVGLLAAIGSAYRVAGRLDVAEQRTREALELYLPLARTDDPLLGMLENNLGDILRERGQLDEARMRLAHARAIWERAWGPDHPQTAMAINNLASADLEAGDTESALARYGEALAIRERAFGPEHPVVATTLSNLGIALRRSGRYGEAREAYVRALAILRARFGDDDPRIATVLAGRASVEAKDGKLADARALLEQALAIVEPKLPAEHPSLAPLLQNHAEVAARLGDATAAERSFARALAIKGASWPASHPKVALARLDFAKALDEGGAHERARELVATALDELDARADPQLRAQLERWLVEADERYPRTDGR